jgi:hypothetical protein
MTALSNDHCEKGISNMRAILLASAAIVVIGSAVPGDAADLAATPRAYRQRVAAYACPPEPGGVLYGRLDRWRARAHECHFDDWMDRPGIDVVYNNWNLW